MSVCVCVCMCTQVEESDGEEDDSYQHQNSVLVSHTVTPQGSPSSSLLLTQRSTSAHASHGALTQSYHAARQQPHLSHSSLQCVAAYPAGPAGSSQVAADAAAATSSGSSHMATVAASSSGGSTGVSTSCSYAASSSATCGSGHSYTRLLLPQNSDSTQYGANTPHGPHTQHGAYRPHGGHTPLLRGPSHGPHGPQPESLLLPSCSMLHVAPSGPSSGSMQANAPVSAARAATTAAAMRARMERAFVKLAPRQARRMARAWLREWAREVTARPKTHIHEPHAPDAVYTTSSHISLRAQHATSQPHTLLGPTHPFSPRPYHDTIRAPLYTQSTPVVALPLSPNTHPTSHLALQHSSQLFATSVPVHRSACGTGADDSGTGSGTSRGMGEEYMSIVQGGEVGVGGSDEGISDGSELVGLLVRLQYQLALRETQCVAHLARMQCINLQELRYGPYNTHRHSRVTHAHTPRVDAHMQTRNSLLYKCELCLCIYTHTHTHRAIHF